MKPTLFLRFASLVILATLPELRAEAVKVAIQSGADGRQTLLRDGKPYRIRGAGGTGHLDDLVRYGGNSIRTWGIDSLEQKVGDQPLLDYCRDKGITVTAGIWIGHERHGFDYSSNEQLVKQREMVRQAVRKYRDHPALLMWGLGNEMEGPMDDGKNPRIWQELNELARIVKQEDPNHPVMTVIAGAADSKVKGILAHYPEIDVLGVNAYSGASGAARSAKNAGWKKPFVLTEFGPQGHWEVAKTPWGAPIEPSSLTKAASYYATLSLLEEQNDICIGSYVFLWGQKQEVTSTWYGMFLKGGEKLPSVDAVCYAWTGKWPSNRSPRIQHIESTLKEAEVKPGRTISVVARAEDAENDKLEWRWSVCEESSDRRVGGDAEAAPPEVAGAVVSARDGTAIIKVPSKPGAYRVFVTVLDGKGGASADNVPFFVKN